MRKLTARSVHFPVQDGHRRCAYAFRKRLRDVCSDILFADVLSACVWVFGDSLGGVVVACDFVPK
jgi:hypothetical protein